MRDMTEPGSEYIDLRDVLDKYNEILSRCDADKEEWEFDYLAIVDALKKELWCDLEQYAENEPTMIHEYEFTNYAQELAYDLGFINRANEGEWPANHIDWDDAAEELKNGDYSEVTFGGHIYYVRTW